MNEQDVIDDYRQRIACAQTEADKYKNLVANAYSLLRLVVFWRMLYFVIIRCNCSR